MSGSSTMKSNNLLMLGGIAIVIIIVAVAVLLLLSQGKSSNQNVNGNNGNNGSGSGTNAGSGSSTDAIAQAFSSNPTLTGAQLANTIAPYIKNAGLTNVSYYGTITQHTVFSSTQTNINGNFTEDYLRKNNTARNDMLVSQKLVVTNPNYRQMINSTVSAIVVEAANGIVYGCSEPINSTKPSMNRYTCFKNPASNTNPLFNYSNPFGSTKSITYRLVGKGSVIGIPCDKLVGSGVVLASGNSSFQAPPINVNVTTCVSFKYYVWLNYTTKFMSSASSTVSNTTVVASATSLNRNVPANLTALPPNVTWG